MRYKLGLLFYLTILLSALLNSAIAQVSGLLEYDQEFTTEGYIYFSGIWQEEAYLIDNCGNLINKWEGEFPAGLSSRLLPNGHILRSDYIGGSCCPQASTGGLLEMRDWNNELVWTYAINDNEKVLHHDFSYMENGNILVLGWEEILAEEALSLGDTSGVQYFWSEFVYEIMPIGMDSADIVWEWHLYDHFVQDVFSDNDNYGVIENEVGKLNINYLRARGDRYHFNAIDYNETRDEILVSSRDNDELYIIDHSTTTEEARTDNGGSKGKGGDFLFRWGNPKVYNSGFNDDRVLYGSHGTHWIDQGLPNEGKLLIFNNGVGTVDMMDPSLDNQGNYILDGSNHFLIDEYKIVQDSVNSFFLSNAQQLPNGNFLINEGDQGQISEIQPDGQTVWKYVIPLRGNTSIDAMTTNNFNSFRAYRYLPTFSGFEGIQLDTLGVLELNAVSCDLTLVDNDNDGFFFFEDCDDDNPLVNPGTLEEPYNGLDDDCDSLTLDDDLDGDGFYYLDSLNQDCDDTNPEIYPGALDIPGNGIDESCNGQDSIVSVKELSHNEIQIFPNPVTQFLTVKIEKAYRVNLDIEILNIAGQRRYRSTINSLDKVHLVDLSSLTTGCYVLKIRDREEVYSELLFVITN